MFEDRRSVVSRANAIRSGFRAVSETSLTGERHGLLPFWKVDHAQGALRESR